MEWLAANWDGIMSILSMIGVLVLGRTKAAK